MRRWIGTMLCSLGLAVVTVADAAAESDRVQSIIRDLSPGAGDIAKSPFDPGRTINLGTVDESSPPAPAPSRDFPEITFEFNSAALKASAQPVLRDIASALNSRELQSYRYIIAGHTDAVGEADYNLQLSTRRARSVRDSLVSDFGVSGTRLEIIGYGESQLANPRNPDADINRRVEIRLSDQANQS